MCGIVGVAGDLDLKSRQIFEDLLVLSQLRGRDSTGVIRVKRNNDTIYHKELGTPDRLFETRTYDKEIDSYDTKVLIGHTRHKTAGSVNRRNAHPFDFENVVGVHNGTLAYTWNRHADSHKFDVDSEWLYSRIDEVGIVEAFENDVDKDGAWALSYWDKRNNTLNFLRNKQRPLHFCWNEAKTIMFWASEPWMLCAVRRLIKVATLNEETEEWTTELPLNTLWSLRVDEKKKPTPFIMEPSIEIEGATFFIPPTRTTHTATHDFRGSTGSSNRGGSGVVHPFQKVEERENRSPTQLPQIPAGTKGGASGSTTTSDSERKSTTISQSGTGQSQPSTSSTKPTRPTLSLITDNSSSSLTTNKRRSSDVCGKSTETLSKNKEGTTYSITKDVSIRKLGGIWYISSKSLCFETSEEEFEQDTGAVCSWCHTPIGDLTEVSFFFDRKNFCCNACEM